MSDVFCPYPDCKTKLEVWEKDFLVVKYICPGCKQDIPTKSTVVGNIIKVSGTIVGLATTFIALTSKREPPRKRKWWE